VSATTPGPAGSAYDGLLEHDADLTGDAAQWAFGTDFEDPLAGVDTAVPDGVEPAVLAAYCLMLGDDALVLSHRLSQWCSHAPDLEEDIALANTALDLLGQARLLLARAAAADPGVVPVLPAGSPVPPEDALAFFRDAEQFRHVRLVEVENGDFAHVVVRLLLAVTVRLAVLVRLEDSRDPVLAAIAAKGVKELTYQRDHAARWVVVLGQGTAESRRRLLGALDELWPLLPELLARHPGEVAAARAGVGVDPGDVAAEVDAVLDQVLAAGGLDRPAAAPWEGAGGRSGVHTADLASMLADMQSVARAHPLGRW